MTMMAARSSMTASAVRKILSDAGTRLPSRASTPSANAMSVAIGMPMPGCVWVPPLSVK
jgi:hypothetical protein